MRLRWFLTLVSVLLVVVGVTVVLHDRLDDGSGAGDQVVSDGGAPPSSSQPRAGTQIAVSGHLTALHLEGAVLDPREVSTPLTIGSERGFGNGGEVTGVTVGGAASSIVWDGGRPFVLSSGPGLRLDPVSVDLVGKDVRCGLGDGSHALLPGRYQLDTPVAVGASGVATSHESVAFDAGDTARFAGHGDAGLVLPGDAEHTFTGPGRVHLEGELVIEQPEGQQTATSVDLESAPFRLTLSPTEDGGWTVSGRVESRVVGDLKLGRVAVGSGPIGAR